MKLTKKKILILTLICLISIGSFVFVKITTPPSLESVINDVVFETSEVCIEVSISNKNDSLKYTYEVSDNNKYIKIVKENSDLIENKSVYIKDDIYYLESNDTTIKLNDNDGINMFNTLKKEVIDLKSYLDIDYSNIKYYYYSEEKITFSHYKDNIFYDNEIVLIDNKLVSLTQDFTVNDVINTVVIRFI